MDNGLDMAQLGLQTYAVIQGAKNDEDNFQYLKDYNAQVLQQQKDLNVLELENQRNINQANITATESQNALNRSLTAEMNQKNIDLADRTNAQNLQIANQNLQFQKDQQEYERQLQQEIFNREDTSYQRTVADMEKVGLSPLAMSGLNSSGSIVGSTALNNSMNYQTPNAMETAEQTTPQSYASAKFHEANIKQLQKNSKMLDALSNLSDTIGGIQSKRLQEKNLALQTAKLAEEVAYNKRYFEMNTKYHDETIAERNRHNVETEKFGNAKNRLLNGILDVVESKFIKDGGVDVQSLIDKKIAEKEKKLFEETVKYYEQNANKHVDEKGDNWYGDSEYDMYLKSNGYVPSNNPKDSVPWNEDGTFNKDWKFY